MSFQWISTTRVVPHEPTGHWAAYFEGELLFRPMEQDEVGKPSHPSLEIDGWYAPDDLSKDEQDRVLRQQLAGNRYQRMTYMRGNHSVQDTDYPIGDQRRRTGRGFRIKRDADRHIRYLNSREEVQS